MPRVLDPFVSAVLVPNSSEPRSGRRPAPRFSYFNDVRGPHSTLQNRKRQGRERFYFAIPLKVIKVKTLVKQNFMTRARQRVAYVN